MNQLKSDGLLLHSNKSVGSVLWSEDVLDSSMVVESLTDIMV